MLPGLKQSMRSVSNCYTSFFYAKQIQREMQKNVASFPVGVCPESIFSLPFLYQ
jgi:hypothetical protein